MKTAIKLIVLTVVTSLSLLGLGWLGYRNVEETKAAAVRVWNDAGYKVVGYEGYQYAPIHGGRVWYLVRRIEDNGITYHGFLAKWGNEYHIYNFQAIDALKP
jgi:hypothetical protein